MFEFVIPWPWKLKHLVFAKSSADWDVVAPILAFFGKGRKKNCKLLPSSRTFLSETRNDACPIFQSLGVRTAIILSPWLNPFSWLFNGLQKSKTFKARNANYKWHSGSSFDILDFQVFFRFNLFSNRNLPQKELILLSGPPSEAQLVASRPEL